jgi:LacI family transcriptional regulator
MTGHKKPNVSDVAKAAGVSIATVSRSFNAPQTVRDTVREKVVEAAARLGYSPNPAAKALRLQKTNMMGVVIPTLDYAFFARLVNSFQETLSRAGHTAIVITTGFDNRAIFDKVKLILEHGAEGVLLVGRIEDQRLREYLLQKRIPVVTTYSYLADEIFPSIGFDNYAATQQLIDYLIGMGHTEITMVSGRIIGNDRQEARVRAFRDAMTGAGHDRTAHIIEKDYVLALPEGAEAMRRIVAEFPKTTAVVCNNDIFAVSVIAECRKRGIRIPADLSVTGFDDLDLASVLDPQLTTIAVPSRDMGERAAEALLNAVLHRSPISSVCLDTSLVVRASTGGPPRLAGTKPAPMRHGGARHARSAHKATGPAN